MSSSDKQIQADALFDEDDLGFDKIEANTILDLRERFDSLSLPARASVAEALLRIDARTLGFSIADEGTAYENVEHTLHELKLSELNKAVEAARTVDSKCGLCDVEFEDGDVILERQSVWVTPGSNQVQMRDDLGERAHASCVKRVKEGGSAEPGMF